MDNKVTSRPEVSVIIPVYNLENYLDACLETVEKQTFGNFEAIVVNDGSTDGTARVLDRHAARDKRIVAVHTPNQGVARARETGLLRAQGRYLCFLDGDDLWDERMLEVMTEAIGNDRYDMVCCNYKRISRAYEAPVRSRYCGEMKGLEFLEALLCNKIWGGLWGKIYRRELFGNGVRHHPLRLWQDVAVNVQIACSGPRVRFIDYVGYGYVQRSESSNHSRLDFDYCRLFCETVAGDIRRHEALLDGRTEYCIVLNDFRTYMMYFLKSRSRWVGDNPFAVSLRKRVSRHRPDLKPHFSPMRMWLLALDRYRMLRPCVIAASTMMRWRRSIQRRLSR